MVAHQQMEQNGLNLEQAMQRPIEMAKEYPVASMLVVFGVGLGVGVLLGQAAPSMSSSSSSWSDSASRAYDRAYDSASRYLDSSYVERLGQQICDAVASAIPSSLARQFKG
jgi:hypothetical protein